MMNELKWAWENSDKDIKISLIPKFTAMCAGYACMMAVSLLVVFA